MNFAYTGIRVKDLDKSIEFYTKLLGLKFKRRIKISETKGEIADLVGEKSGFAIELNYYEKDSPYNTEYAVGEA
jgi:catechol 2,3-dioxygenase-like lactoylglutathione lyase family enzyme